MSEAFGAYGLDEAHDCTVLRIGGIFKDGFVSLIDEQKWNVREAIVLANDENKVAAAELFAFGFGHDEGGRFGFQNFESEMGGADGDDLVALLFKSSSILCGGGGIGIDNEDSGTRAADGMRFDGRDTRLLHGSVEMDGDVVALIGTRNGANDLGALSGSGGVGYAGIGEDHFESLADPVARAPGGEEQAVTGNVHRTADFLKGFDSADAASDEDRRSKFGSATTTAFARLASGVGGTHWRRRS